MNDLESRIRNAYHDESYQLPEAALPTVVRRRRLALAAASVAVAAVIGGATMAITSGGLPSLLSGGVDPAAEPDSSAELCERLGTEALREQHPDRLRDEDRTMPDRMVSFSQQGQWLHLYLGDHVIVTCLGLPGTGDAYVAINPLAYFADPDVTVYTQVMAPIAWSMTGGQSYVVVTAPLDTERVTAQLPDGASVTAVAAGTATGTRIYVAWLPWHWGDGLGAVDELTLTAYTPDTVYLYESGETTTRDR